MVFADERECANCGKMVRAGAGHICTKGRVIYAQDFTEKLRGAAVSPEELYAPIKPAEQVNHPPHYQSNGIEAIDVIEAFAPTNYHRGNALKYLLRAGRKGREEDTATDLRKAIWYIERELKA